MHNYFQISFHLLFFKTSSSFLSLFANLFAGQHLWSAAVKIPGICITKVMTFALLLNSRVAISVFITEKLKMVLQFTDLQ